MNSLGGLVSSPSLPVHFAMVFLYVLVLQHNHNAGAIKIKNLCHQNKKHVSLKIRKKEGLKPLPLPAEDTAY